MIYSWIELKKKKRNKTRYQYAEHDYFVYHKDIRVIFPLLYLLDFFPHLYHLLLVI